MVPTLNFKVKPAFTLIELLIVVTILGILASLVVASFDKAQQKSRDSLRKTDVDALKKTMELAKHDSTGQYYFPNCDTGTSCNITNTNTNPDLAPATNPYIKAVPTDPKTKAGYLYLPIGCVAGGCTDYTLVACLENANDPQGVTDATNCSAAPQKAYKQTPN